MESEFSSGTSPLEAAQNKRILVIDDNEAIHQDIRKILCPSIKSSADIDSVEESLFGKIVVKDASYSYDVDSAYQGEEGLNLIRQSLNDRRPYAMAFVDVRMPPGWDGIETVARIWNDYPDLQVVVCTAYSDYSWPDIIDKLGHSDRLVILKKPFDNVEALQLASTMTEKWRLYQSVKARLKHLEELVNQRTAEICSTNRELKKANENLLTEMRRANSLAEAALVANESKSKALAMVSHELRTPASGIVGLADLILDTKLDAEQQELAGTIKDCGESLLRLISDILDFSKADAGKVQLESLPFGVGDVVNQALLVIKPHAVKKGISLTADIPIDTPFLCGDPFRLRQVFLNLLSNAVKFTDQGGVTLKAAVSKNNGNDAELTLEVSDTGVGMSPEVMATLFEPFAQGDESISRRYGGTGLGLSITRTLVKQMGGEISVSSIPAQGSTFKLVIPFPLEMS